MMKIIYCKECGFENIEGSLICYDCGAVLAEDKNKVSSREEYNIKENIYKLPSSKKDFFTFKPLYGKSPVSMKDRVLFWIGNNSLFLVLLILILIGAILQACHE